MTTRRRVLVRGTLVILAVAALAAVLVVVGVVPPTANTWYPKCMSYQVAGIHCPGCGMTRAVHLALNGRIPEALSQNALAVVVVPYLLFVFLTGLWHYLWQKPLPKSRWPKWATWALVAVVLLFMVARNIPVPPFTLLAPSELPAKEVEDTPPG
jgi:hypothetical protein